MVGRTLAGRYRLDALLGEGGNARVYRAWDLALRVPRAVKVVRPELGAGPEGALALRLRDEARAMARIGHPGVVGVHDIGQESGHDFIVMDLLPGGSLSDRLRREGPLPPAEAVGVMLAVLGVLEAAHRAGVVHRDVKPGNLLLDAEGKPRVADFGIARILVEDWTRHTRAGVAMGSWSYMSPEQRTDARSVGPPADVYSAGATLYVLLTAASPADLFMAGEASPRLQAVPPGLRPVVVRATRYEAEDRYPSAAQMAAALRNVELAGLPAQGPWAEGGAPTLPPPTAADPASTLAPAPSHAAATGPEAPGARPTRRPSRGRRLAAAGVVGGAGLILALGVTARLGEAAWAPPGLAGSPDPVPAASGDERAEAAPATEGGDRVPPVPAEPAPQTSPAPAADGPAPPAPAGTGERAADRTKSPPPTPMSAATPAPAPGEERPAPVGAWQATFGGRKAALRLEGAGGKLTGELVVTQGANEVRTPVQGTWDGAGALVLVDPPDLPDGGTYTLVVDAARARMTGTFTRRDGRGTVPVVGWRAP